MNECGGHVCQFVLEGTEEYDAYRIGYINETDKKDWGL